MEYTGVFMSRLSERIENFNKAFDMFERTYNLYISEILEKIEKLYYNEIVNFQKFVRGL